MVRKIALTLMLSGGLLFVSSHAAYAQEAAPVAPAAPAVTETFVVPPPPVEVKDPEKEPPKVDRNQRKMGIGGDGGGGRGGRQQPQVSIFAFPGAKCPAGSSLYKGPETKMAAAENVVYCVMLKEVVVLPKTGKGCGGRLKPYKDANVKPDDDVIWCKKIPDGPNAPGAQQGDKGKVKKVF